MITSQQIEAKASRLFGKVVKEWLQGRLASFFPYRLPANLTLPPDHARAIVDVERLRDASKESLGHGYRVVWQTRRSRTHGLNRFPDAIMIDTMDDLVQLAKCEEPWQRLQAAVATLRRRQPLLNHWLTTSTHWKSLLECADVLDDLLSIVDYFVAHPRPDCFARELPVPVSTKLIEGHRRRLATWLDIVLPSHAIDLRYGYDAFEPRYGLRYARPHYLLRVLDVELQQELGLPFAELSLPADSLSKLAVREVGIIIVENKVSLLSLPRMNRSLALGGLGNGVTQLSAIEWLKQNHVYYWGDLDAEGYAILDRLRQLLPATQSLLMCQPTVDQFSHLATPGNAVAAKILDNLTDQEQRCYQHLCANNTRIEQEHLPMQTVVEQLNLKTL
ncbi:Wadjet anti-phage system protein JetD domain-containing protein [Roseimaritima ulvae]|uniref:Wadjet protein JetD C-terminal domain-containing protein n=1 Tax=Roseimaritima ulvae TaxID=980254 RepID=A0A5B9QYT2_9BACT|nr:DUF3322 and DUF2220 domain-containing protein [Roseimaritima ulvae]QEG43099.1 hypothetical protein UC8_51430 [Roseimaritima ulvae]